MLRPGCSSPRRELAQYSLCGQSVIQKILLGPARHAPPWAEIERVMAKRGAAAPHAYIRDYIGDLTKFFPWLP